MRPLSAGDMLWVWEQGTRVHPIDQALMLLGLACPDQEREALAGLPLGRRDALLLELRHLQFGDHIGAYVECPACGDSLELDTACRALLAAAPLAGSPTLIELDGVALLLRAPNSMDAAAAAACGDADMAVSALLARCLSPVPGAGEGGASHELPASSALREIVSRALAVLDPLSEIALELHCSGCGHAWQPVLDVASFLWDEVRVRARRLMQDIDALARVYHWSEAQILALSEARRTAYVQMALS